MPHAALRAVLRLVAIAIALAALVDPALTVARPVARHVVVARLASSDVSAQVRAVKNGLEDADVIVRDAVNGRLPCAADEPCIGVTDGSVDVELPSDRSLPLSLMVMAAPVGPNVALQSAVASIAQHATAAGTLRVSMNGNGVTGRRTEIRVSDGSAVVGAAIHEWKADGAGDVTIAWWPMAAGPRVLHVEAVPVDGETSVFDNTIDLGLNVSVERTRVLVFDPRPSWASTFVRRALEDDQRFRVEHRTSLGPSLAIATSAGKLDAATLDATPVVVVGAPDGLRAGDVDLLERFVRVRGGTLVLLPDRVPVSPGTRLFQGRWSERLETAAVVIGPLRASEILRMEAVSGMDVTLASANGSPAIVMSPMGNGRVIVSGAMDAWRHRDADGGAFDRFWKSVVAEAAVDSAPLRLAFEERLATPGSTMAFEVHDRRMQPPAAIAMTATAACGDRPSSAVRLWPAGGPGVFTGRLPIDDADACQLTVAVADGGQATAGIAVARAASRGVSQTVEKLERYAKTSGGIVMKDGDERAAAATSWSFAPSTVPMPVRPMRSPWWILPFAACSSVEWWLRRRSGLR